MQFRAGSSVYVDELSRHNNYGSHSVQMLTSDIGDAMKKVRDRDPSFSITWFVNHIKEELIPKFIEADTTSNIAMFKDLCTEPVRTQRNTRNSVAHHHWKVVEIMVA